MSDVGKRNMVGTFFAGFLGLLLVWNVFLNFQSAKDTNLNYFYAVGYSLFYLFVAVLSFLKLRKVGIKSATSKALLFMSIGAFIFTFAFWLYTYFIYTSGSDIPYPSIADYFFLSFVPFVAIGFSYLIRIFAPVLSRRVVVETLLITLLGVGLMFYFLILPKFGEDVSTMERVFNIIYPLNDTILLAMMLIALRSSGGKIQGYFLRFIIAFSLMITGDLLYSFRTSHDTQWNGDIVDLVFTLTAFSFAMAMVKLMDSAVEPSATFNPVAETQQLPIAPQV